jgi:hypothetical protein
MGVSAADVQFTPVPPEPGEVPGQTKAELFVEGKAVSHLYVVPFTVRVGRATVRMDGIAGVGTDREHRNKGYSRRVIEATIEHMTRGDAALTMLYGIPDFYPKFGYATAGADHYVYLTYLWSKRTPTRLPNGWTARPFAKDDLPAVRRLYDLNTARDSTVGAALRPADSAVWHALLSSAETAAAGTPEGCRVAVDSAGEVRAYAWRGTRFWYASMLERRHRHAFILSEVMADGPASADAIVVACRLWARERSEGNGDPFRHVLVSQPPEGPVAAAAALTDARTTQRTSATGESMARILDVDRLISSLAPELRARLADSLTPPLNTLRFVTDLGESTLSLGGQGALTAHLPSTTLAQLALGAHDPADLLARLPTPPDPQTHAVLLALFPKRNQHMYVPDRY